MTPPSGDLVSALAGLQPRHVALVVVAALGYAVATIGMKLASASLSVVALILIVVGFVGAGLAEISLLKKADLGVIYITIIGVETLLVLGFATLIGEGLDLRRVMGAGLVIGGIALISN